MILGLGIDAVEIARVQRLHGRFGDRLAQRLLAPGEWGDYGRAADPAAMLAKRFAVKEAAGKALGTGLGRGVALHDIVVDHDAGGGPRLWLNGAAAARAAAMGVSVRHVSIADERSVALAVVVLEGEDA